MKKLALGALCTLLILLPGCGDRPPQPPLAPVGNGLQDHVEPPPHLLAHVRLGAPARLLADANALGRRLGAWKLGSGELRAVAEELARTTTDLAEHMDWTRPLHALVLDPARHRSPLVWVLPVRSPRAALSRLVRHCQGSRRGAHWTFTGGGRGLLPCAFEARPLPRWLVVTKHRRTLDAVWRFALATTQGDRRPGHDLEVRLFVANVMAKAGLTRTKLQHLAQLGSTLVAFSTGDLDAGPRLQKQLGRLIEYATSATDAGFTVDFGAGGFRVQLFATGRPGGALQQWIQRPRPGAPPRLSPLPPRAPIALTLPRPDPDNAKPQPGPVLGLLLGRLPAWLKPGVTAVLNRILIRRGGSLRLALEPVDSGGLCLVLLLEHPRPGRLRTALRDELVGLLAATRKQLKGYPLRAFGVSERIAADTHHLRVDLGGDWPRGAVGGQLVAQWIAGGESLPIAMTHHGRHLVVALGADAPRQALETRQRLAKKPGALPQAQGASTTGRLGRLRLSLVELVRAIPILGVSIAPTSARGGGIELHWGVSPARRRIDATLELPLDHLLASAPLWKWLLDRLEAQATALQGLTPVTGPEPEDAL